MMADFTTADFTTADFTTFTLYGMYQFIGLHIQLKVSLILKYSLKTHNVA